MQAEGQAAYGPAVQIRGGDDYVRNVSADGTRLYQRQIHNHHAPDGEELLGEKTLEILQAAGNAALFGGQGHLGHIEGGQGGEEDCS